MMGSAGTVIPFDAQHRRELAVMTSPPQQVSSDTSPASGSRNGTSDPPDEEALPLSREDVRMAFELLLGRQAESEETIRHHRALADRVALGAAIRESLEFRSRNAPLRHQSQDFSHIGKAPEPPQVFAGGDCAPLATWSFVEGGNGVSFLQDGWSVPEQEFCWSIGLRSEMELPLPPGEFARGLALTLWLVPSHGTQQFSIEVDGVIVASGLVRRRMEFACRVPPHLLAGRDRLHLVLHHPDASRPCDHGASLDERMLGVGVGFARFSTLPSDAEPPDDAALMQAFTSFGDNCEFGFVQQRCGVFNGGLLRFSTMPPDRLLHGLATSFEGFPDRSRMRLERHATRGSGKEYVVYEDGYGFTGHTGVSDLLGPKEEEELLDGEHSRVSFLKRMLLDDLESGDTIFVFKRNVMPPEAEVMALWLAIRRLGRCTLLWVVPAHPGAPDGTVSMLAEGLFKASIDRLAPYTDAEDLSLESWLTICRRTLRLSRLGSAQGL